MLNKNMDKFLLNNLVHKYVVEQIMDKYLLNKTDVDPRVCCFVLLRGLLNKTEQTQNTNVVTLLLC